MPLEPPVTMVTLLLYRRPEEAAADAIACEVGHVRSRPKFDQQVYLTLDHWMKFAKGSYSIAGVEKIETRVASFPG